MLMYDYIISYAFNSDKYLTPCTGTTQISRKKKLKTFDDVNKLSSEIAETIDGAYNFSINNIVLLGRNWH